MVLILIFLLILFLKKVCFFLVRFGLFWFNLVFSKPIWKNKNQFGLICFYLVYFGFVFSKIFTMDKKFTNFLLTFCKIHCILNSASNSLRGIYGRIASSDD